MVINENVVSLIIPCYNGENYIDRCINNIIEQTYCKKIELIIVNDGSTDKSKELLLEKQSVLEQQCFKFIFVDQENQGVASAVNNALKFVSGEYLALLDIDDFMTSDSIEKRVCWLQSHQEYSAVLNNGYYYYEGGKKQLIYAGSNHPTTNAFEEMLESKTASLAGTYMVRTKVMLEIYPDREIYLSRYGQNLQIILPATYKKLVGYINEPLMYYYMHTRSMTHDKDDDGQKRINQSYEFQKIYLNVLKNICSEEEMKKYENILQATFSKSRMYIASTYKNYGLLKKYYGELKETNLITFKDKIIYISYFSKTVAFLIKILKKIL